MGELNQVEHDLSGTAGRGEQGHVVLMDRQPVPDLEERAHPRPDRRHSAGQVGDEGDRAAAAGGKKPPGQLAGGDDVHGPGHSRPGHARFPD